MTGAETVVGLFDDKEQTSHLGGLLFDNGVTLERLEYGPAGVLFGGSLNCSGKVREEVESRELFDLTDRPGVAAPR